MKCNRCGNSERFTVIREIKYWDKKKKIFEDILNGKEYCVCDDCMMSNQEKEAVTRTKIYPEVL